MHLRRPLPLAAGALVLALGLSSCGFDLATDRPYQPGEGTNDTSGDVSVLSALVVAAQPNEGTVVVTFVNDSDEEQTLSSVSSPDTEVADFDPIAVPANGYLNLADDGGPLISGDFDAGQLIPVTFTFDNGQETAFDVPIVTACGDYLGLDLTEDSDNIPYACDLEPEPVGGEE